MKSICSLSLMPASSSNWPLTEGKEPGLVTTAPECQPITFFSIRSRFFRQMECRNPARKINVTDILKTLRAQ